MFAATQSISPTHLSKVSQKECLIFFLKKIVQKKCAIFSQEKAFIIFHENETFLIISKEKAFCYSETISYILRNGIFLP